jgi:hypothetical protein
VINGVSIPQMILGDQGYPLIKGVLIPYRESMTAGNPQRQCFNLAVSKTRICVENIIGKLKNRFKVLECMKLDVGRVPRLIMSCVVLFNIYKSLNIVNIDDLFDGTCASDDNDTDELIPTDATAFVVRETIAAHLHNGRR